MSKIKIDTAQHIYLEYEIANVFERSMAWLIDFFVLFGYVLIVSILFIPSMRFGNDSAQGWYVLMLVPALFYHLVLEIIMDGRSLGKLTMGLRVISLDGGSPTWSQYFMRWTLRILETNPIFFYGAVGISSVSLNPRGQRLGDTIAGTTVVRQASYVSLRDTILMSSGRFYTAVFPQASRLSDRDVNTIREVIGIYETNRNSKLLNYCANKVCRVLEIRPPKKLDAYEFLNIILQDYTSLS